MLNLIFMYNTHIHKFYVLPINWTFLSPPNSRDVLLKKEERERGTSQTSHHCRCCTEACRIRFARAPSQPADDVWACSSRECRMVENRSSPFACCETIFCPCRHVTWLARALWLFCCGCRMIVNGRNVSAVWNMLEHDGPYETTLMHAQMCLLSPVL